MAEQRKILAIDDEAVIRDSCSRILAQEGCDIVTAADGEEGLAAIKADPKGFEVVLLDLKMPGMSGMEVLEQAREVNPALLVVVITGYATVDTAVEAMKKGAYDFIAKPFTPDQLHLVVNRAQEKRRLELEAEQLRAEAARSLRDVATEKSKVRTIVNSMAYGIVVTDREGRVVLLNPAASRMLRTESKACLEKSLSETVDDKKLMEAVQEVVSQEPRGNHLVPRIPDREFPHQGSHNGGQERRGRGARDGNGLGGYDLSPGARPHEGCVYRHGLP